MQILETARLVLRAWTLDDVEDASRRAIGTLMLEPVPPTSSPSIARDRR